MIAKKKAEIEFGGEMRTFYFGLGFLGLYVEKTDNPLDNLLEDVQKNPFKVIPDLMYYSLLYGFIRQEIAPPFNRYDVIDWIDEEGGVGGEKILKFMELLGDSMNPNLPEDKSIKKKNKVRPIKK